MLFSSSPSIELKSQFPQHTEMDRFLHRNKEYMKMAMLKHEEMFKEQVTELHRLYRVQTMLMEDLKNSRHPEEQPEVVQESEIELTLATGGSRRKREDVSFASEEERSRSLSSSSAESGGENSKVRDWGMLQMADMNKNELSNRLDQPSWHFQCLSLRMS